MPRSKIKPLAKACVGVCGSVKIVVPQNEQNASFNTKNADEPSNFGVTYIFRQSHVGISIIPTQTRSDGHAKEQQIATAKGS
jgi:hypothetical protein